MTRVWIFKPNDTYKRTRMKFILFFLLCAQAFAGESIDRKLSIYIQEFKLKSLKSPGERREKLFILGQKLFHERRLSGNDNIRCLDCHHPKVRTQEGIPLSVGEGALGIQYKTYTRKQRTGRVLARNTPALFNLHGVDVLFWDGRVQLDSKTGRISTPVPLRADIAAVIKSALAAQALFPMVDHDEMRGKKGTNAIANARDEYEAWDLIVEKIISIPKYEELFSEIYPGETINIGHFGEALAEFETQNFYYADTPYDSYLKGNLKALTPKQKLGMDVFFNKGKCGECHQGEYLSSFGFRSVGSPQIGPGKVNGDDFGRYQWDRNESNKYAFRVPPLRNVGLTAPYSHNGAFNTLEEIVDHYSDVKASLQSYKILVQFSNYLKPLKDHDHSTDEARYLAFPDNLPLKVDFTQNEKEVLIEFLRTGLKDVRLQ